MKAQQAKNLSFLSGSSEGGRSVSLREFQPRPLTASEFVRAADQLARGREFDGDDLLPRDISRIRGTLEAVKNALAGGRWWTLKELTETCGGSEAGISARLRDCRKVKHGALTIERRRRTSSQWEYRWNRQERRAA